jgi:hypothetical protein
MEPGVYRAGMIRRPFRNANQLSATAKPLVRLGKPPAALTRGSGSVTIGRLYSKTAHKRVLHIARVFMSCRPFYFVSARRDQVQGQPRVSRKPTLRMHKAGTVVLLAAISCVSFIAAGGLAAAVLEKMSPGTVTTNDPLSQLRTVVICLGGWFFCSHYLWRCYRSGLEDVRGLLRQLSQLEQIRETFTAERRALRKQHLLAGPLSRPDAANAPETSQEQAPKPKRSRTRAPTPQVDVTSVDNVVELESYRRP